MNKLVYDIGASNIKFALMTDEGEILERRKMPTPRTNLEDYVNGLVSLAGDLAAQADGAAVSTNGRMYPDGDTYRAYTADFLKDINIKAELESRLHMPAAVENDGVAATVGEWWQGAAKGCQNVLGIVLGSGMGAGLIIDGKPVRGAKNNSAMVFGMTATADLTAGKYVASAVDTAFPLAMYKIAMAKQMSFADLTGPKVFEMAAAGDPIVGAVLESYYRGVAITVYNSAALLDPDCVVITGGLAQQPLLIQGIQRNLDDIGRKVLTYEGIDLSSQGIMLEPEDFHVRITPGKLCLDANLYGALYKLLH